MSRRRTCLDCGFLTIEGEELSLPDRVQLGTFGASGVMPHKPERTRCSKQLWISYELLYCGDDWTGVVEELKRPRDDCSGFLAYEAGFSPAQHLEIQRAHFLSQESPSQPQAGRAAPDRSDLQTRPLRTFVSYAHEDEEHRRSLGAVLRPFEREGWVEVWSDVELIAGQAWADRIAEEVEQADLFLMLVSQDFLASDFVHEKEVRRALERRQEGTADVVPIVVRDCDWSSSPLKYLQALPKGAEPISAAPDQGWKEVSVGLRKLITERLDLEIGGDTGLEPGAGVRKSERSEETPWASTRAQYFEDGEDLAAGSGAVQVSYDSLDRVLYLRVIPSEAHTPLKNSELRDAVFGINLLPLRQDIGGGSSWAMNRYGGLTYSYVEYGDIKMFTTSQVFKNREIWGLDAFTLAPARSNFDLPMPPAEVVFIGAVEKCLQRGLEHYLDVAETRLGLSCPLEIEAGVEGLEGLVFVTGNDYSRLDSDLRIIENQVVCRRTLPSLSPGHVERLLLELFEEFWQAAAKERPAGYRGLPSSS